MNSKAVTLRALAMAALIFAVAALSGSTTSGQDIWRCANARAPNRVGATS